MNYRVVKVGLRLGWSCADSAKHHHDWWIEAWVCSMYQRWKQVRRIG